MTQNLNHGNSQSGFETNYEQTKQRVLGKDLVDGLLVQYDEDQKEHYSNIQDQTMSISYLSEKKISRHS